jgi:dihydropteroate synthase
MFKPTAAKTPEEYIQMLPESDKTEFVKVFEFVKKEMPNDKPYIAGGMIGFRSQHYKSKSGREGEWPLFALASRKNYISLYVCAADGKQYVAEKYQNELPKADIGRSCIRFKKIEDIDLVVLKKVLKEASTLGLTFA